MVLSQILETSDSPISVPDLAYSVLLKALLHGHIQPGESLNQDEIAKSLGFSRVPIREALKRLEGEGLVIQRPRRGYIVAALDADAVVDVFDVRMVLEGHAGYLATMNRTDADVADVRRILEELEVIQSRKDYDQQAWSEVNRRFHDRLFAPCKRPHLLRMLAQQRNLVTLYVRIGGSIAPDITQTSQDHREILEAYADKNADEVARLSREHVQKTKTRLVAKLRELT